MNYTLGLPPIICVRGSMKHVTSRELFWSISRHEYANPKLWIRSLIGRMLSWIRQEHFRGISIEFAHSGSLVREACCRKSREYPTRTVGQKTGPGIAPYGGCRCHIMWRG